MNTFLPYPSFEHSAVVLDRQRLGKQRLEVLQLIRALTVPGAGWGNHPAAKMWAGYVPALANYGIAMCDEWISRGYNDTCRDQFLAYAEPDAPLPPWVGDDRLHSSHRSALLYKDPTWYGQWEWKDPLAAPNAKGSLPYYWPTKE